MRDWISRIGLPTASVFAGAGADVIGVDIDERVVQEVALGIYRFRDEPRLELLVKKSSFKIDAKLDCATLFHTLQNSQPIPLTLTLFRRKILFQLVKNRSFSNFNTVLRLQLNRLTPTHTQPGSSLLNC